MSRFHCWTSMSREINAIPLEADTAYIAAREFAMAVGISNFIPWEDAPTEIIKGMFRYDLSSGLDYLPFFAVYVKEY